MSFLCITAGSLSGCIRNKMNYYDTFSDGYGRNYDTVKVWVKQQTSTKS